MNGPRPLGAGPTPVGKALLTLGALCALHAAALSAVAQAPSIASLSPLGVRPGQAQDLVLRGGALDGATQLWTSFPAKAELTPGKADNGKNAAEVSYRVTVPPETPPGIYGVRLATSKGISPLRILLVDDLPPIAQQPGNLALTTAQAVSLPAAVDGSLDALARHYYRFRAEAGQRVSMEILARRIGSPLDPMLRLFDSAGREIASSDDEPGLSGDAQIEHTFKAPGEFLLEVSDIRYLGGGYYYRLRLGDFPAAPMPSALGAKRNSDVTYRFPGSAGRELEPVLAKAPADPLADAFSVPVRYANGSIRGFSTVLLSDRAEQTEVEPNNDLKSATKIEAGSNISGRLDAAKDVDQFRFAGKANTAWKFSACARKLGSPADVVLRLLKADGGQVAQAESAANAEAALTATLPADGEYVLEVRDLSFRGGPRFAYHVDVAPAQSGFTLAASADALNIPAGGTGTVTVTAVRNGYDGPIRVAIKDLPAGITAVPTTIGPGRTSAVFSVRATANAPAGKVLPVRIVGTANVAGKPFEAVASLNDALKTQWGNMPYPPVGLLHASAIGIGPAAQFALRVEPSPIVFGRDLSATVKVFADRQAGFTEEITLALTPEKENLPAGITATVKPIPKDANSVDIVFSANNKAPLGDFTAALVGTLKKDKASFAQPAPGVGLSLKEPLTISVAPATKLARKGTQAIKVTVLRNPAFNGDVTLSVIGLPKGVTAAPVTLLKDKSEAGITLTAAADAAVGAVANLTVQAEATVGKEKFKATAPLAGLTIE